MVLGKISSAEAFFTLDDSKARACWLAVGAGGGLCGHFYSPLSFLFSFSLSLGDGPI